MRPLASPAWHTAWSQASPPACRREVQIKMIWCIKESQDLGISRTGRIQQNYVPRKAMKVYDQGFNPEAIPATWPSIKLVLHFCAYYHFVGEGKILLVTILLPTPPYKTIDCCNWLSPHWDPWVASGLPAKITVVPAIALQTSVDAIFHHGNKLLVAQEAVPIVVKYLENCKKSLNHFSASVVIWSMLGKISE